MFESFIDQTAVGRRVGLGKSHRKHPVFILGL